MAEEFAGRYRLEQKLGQGGMGEVWKAYDLRLGRYVALKRQLRSTDDTERVRFLRECGRAARLQHRHIAAIHDYADADGRLYLTMQYIEGSTLSALAEKAKGLRVDQAVTIVEQVASALDHLHRKGIVHRDVKPANIMVDGESGDAFLIDFGLSFSVSGSTADHRLTADGYVAGTLDYMAPECFDGAEPDTAMDIYSLACVLYESLTGRRPFPRRDNTLRIQAHRSEPPPRATTHNARLPTAIDVVIAHGMAKSPRRRFTTAGGLAAAARATITSPVESEAQQSGPPTAREERVRTKIQPQSTGRSGTTRTLVRRTAIGLVVVGLGAAGWWFLRPGSTPPQPPDVRIEVGATAGAVAVGASGTTAFVVATETATLAVLDLATGTTSGRVAVGAEPEDVVVAPDGRRAYTANAGDGTVSVVDLTTQTVEASIPVDGRPTSLAISDQESRLYVGNSGSASLSVVDTVDGSVVETVRLGAGFLGDRPTGVAIDPDGTRIAVSMPRYWFDDCLVLVDVATGETLGEVPVGENPQAVTFGPGGERAYVVNQADSTVSVVDVANGAVTTTVPVAPGPTSIALTADGSAVVVAGPGSATITVIDIATNVARDVPSPIGAPTDVQAVPGGGLVVANEQEGTVAPVAGF